MTIVQGDIEPLEPRQVLDQTLEDVNWPAISEALELDGPKRLDVVETPPTSLHDVQSPMTDTCTTVYSSESGHQSQAAYIVTPKFTNKWPKPSALRYLDGQSDIKRLHTPLVGTPVETIEEGKVGIISVGKWTLAKISLVASVMLVFVFGTTFLILTSMTWFNGQFFLIVSCMILH